MKKSASETVFLPLTERTLRGDIFASDCPARGIMRRMTSSWSVLTLIALRQGTLRFSALHKKIGGVSERMLAQTLKGLQGDGLVVRRAFSVVPPHVDYALTPLGREAADKIANVAEWIEENVASFTASRP